MDDESAEGGGNHVAGAFDCVVNAERLAATVGEVFGDERDGDGGERRGSKPLHKTHEQKELGANDEKEQRPEDEDDKPSDQGQFHPSSIREKAGQRFRKQLREIIDGDQQSDDESACANRLRIRRQIRRDDVRSE